MTHACDSGRRGSATVRPVSSGEDHGGTVRIDGVKADTGAPVTGLHVIYTTSSKRPSPIRPVNVSATVLRFNKFYILTINFIVFSWNC